MTNPNKTKLSQQQLLQRTFDENSDRLRVSLGDDVDSLAVNSNGSINTILQDADGDPYSEANRVPVIARLEGLSDSGNYVPVPVDNHGHLEVAIHGPIHPFGSVHTESLNVVAQGDAVYGIDTAEYITGTNASGTVTAPNSSFVCTTGNTIYGAGYLLSNKRLVYRPGQGSIARFTGLFTTGVANSYQVAGIGHAEDGFYFGYKGADFGIIYNNRGKREVQTLTISTKSSTAENVTVTLGGVPYTVAVTNGANTLVTAFEISKGSFGGWRAELIGSTVLFINSDVGNKVGTFSLTGTTVVGSFVETQAGQAVTETFIPQTAWNGDKLDGTGNSGVTADWTKFNIFQIGVQYLGAGVIVFQVETAPEGNNGTVVTVHTLSLPNTLTETSIGNPSFQFLLSAYSMGSTTDLTVKCGSFMLANEGGLKIHGKKVSYNGSSTAVGAAAYTPLYTLRNTRYFGSRSNQSEVKILNIHAAIKHTSPVTIFILKDATIGGIPNFQQYAPTSCIYLDTASTTVTLPSNLALLWSATLGDTGNFSVDLNDMISINPGETITIAARSLAGTPAYVVVSINTQENQ